MSYFSLLPDEILAKIVNRLPLRDLLRIELVNHRFQSVQCYVRTRITSLTLYSEAFALKHSALKHSDFFQLMFFEPLNYHPLYSQNNNSLLCDTFDLSTILRNVQWQQGLVGKLTNITKLSLWGISFYNACDFKYLFGKWSKLEQLNIAHGARDNIATIDLKNFWSLVNGLKCLKHLGLFSQLFVETFYSFNWNLHSQLETLCLDYACNGLLVDTLLNQGPNSRRLFLTNFSCTKEELISARLDLKKNADWANTFNQVTHLTLEYNRSQVFEDLLEELNIVQEDHVTVPVLNFIVDHFGSLTHLDICLSDQIYFADISSQLSRLQLLTSLRLSVLSDRTDTQLLFPDNGISALATEPIVSVTKLHLNLPWAPIAPLYRKLLQIVFPKLRELHLENSMFIFDCVTNCTKDVKTIPKYRLFGGGPMCWCEQTLWNAFRKAKSLCTVYRNTNLVYDHKSDSFDLFLSRLSRFGQSYYTRLIR